jgi:ferredoxin
MKKVVVDYELCEANAVCMKLAPEVFQVDAQDNLHVLLEQVPADLLDKVQNAVRRCPKRALSLVDE